MCNWLLRGGEKGLTNAILHDNNEAFDCIVVVVIVHSYQVFVIDAFYSSNSIIEVLQEFFLCLCGATQRLMSTIFTATVVDAEATAVCLYK